MPYFLMSDTIGRDPRWHVLAAGKPALEDALQASLQRLYSEAASHMHDGYLTRTQALGCCRGRARTLELLCTPVLGGRPFLHRPGDTCGEKNCLDQSGPWIAGFDYRICGFLKRNPAKSERDRNEAQKADSRDDALRKRVYARDGGCCRYCRSGPLKSKGMGRAKDRRRALQFDHIDPDRPAGADDANYVTACARCNEQKGHRTPDEADMVLLPEPTDAQKAAWTSRGEQQFDPGAQACAEPVDNDNDNPADNPHDNHNDNAHDNAPSVVDVACPDDSHTGVVRPESPAQAQQQPAALSPEGSGSGRVGHRVLSPAYGALGQPVRTPDAPDIYHRRSRAPIPDSRPPPPAAVP